MRDRITAELAWRVLDSHMAGDVDGLTTAVQRWMDMEAAAVLDRLEDVIVSGFPAVEGGTPEEYSHGWHQASDVALLKLRLIRDEYRAPVRRAGYCGLCRRRLGWRLRRRHGMCDWCRGLVWAAT